MHVCAPSLLHQAVTDLGGEYGSQCRYTVYIYMLATTTKIIWEPLVVVEVVVVVVVVVESRERESSLADNNDHSAPIRDVELKFWGNAQLALT